MLKKFRVWGVDLRFVDSRRLSFEMPKCPLKLSTVGGSWRQRVQRLLAKRGVLGYTVGMTRL